MPDFLPDLIVLSAYGGNWGDYLAAVYRQFEADYLAGDLQFEGRPIRHKWHPVTDGKSATFWHMTSEGSKEEDRTPDLRRCERIRWSRALILNCTHESVRVWVEEVRGEPRVHIWCEDAEYLVVLADRGSYLLLWTAFWVEQPHQRRKLNRRFEEAQKGTGR